MATHISKKMNILKIAKTPNYKAMKNRQDVAQIDIMLGNIKQKLRQKNGRRMILHTSKRAYRRKIEKMRGDNIKE